MSPTAEVVASDREYFRPLWKQYGRRFLDPLADHARIREAIQKLEQKDPRKAELVKLRFFAGLSMDQIAHLLGVSERTVHNMWSFSKAWLYHRLKEVDCLPKARSRSEACRPDNSAKGLD